MGKILPVGAGAVKLEDSSTPHFYLRFKGLTKGENKNFSIRGVNSFLAKFLGDHSIVQKWDFEEYDSSVILLVPKRYMILGLVFSSFFIYLVPRKEEGL